MKNFKILMILSALLMLSSVQPARSTEVLDNNTVYAPKINICVSSFGGLIQSREIIVSKKEHSEILRTRELLTRWIYESNSAGFYLQQFEPSQFYWQFVETKKYIGAILVVTGDPINQQFYKVLGSGLNTDGKKFYGLDSPAGLNGDLFSFVVRKQDYKLEHFENWKFSEHTPANELLSTARTRNLASKSEQKKLARASNKSKSESAHRDVVRLAFNQNPGNGPALKRDSLPYPTK